MIAPEAGLSISRQYTLLGLARSSFYYRPRPESAEELEVLKRLDRIFTDHPVYGSRRVVASIENRRRQRHEAPEQIKGFPRVLTGHRLDDRAPLGIKVLSQRSDALPVDERS